MFVVGDDSFGEIVKEVSSQIHLFFNLSLLLLCLSLGSLLNNEKEDESGAEDDSEGDITPQEHRRDCSKENVWEDSHLNKLLKIIFWVAQEKQKGDNSVIDQSEMVDPEFLGVHLWIIKEAELGGDNNVD